MSVIGKIIGGAAILGFGAFVTVGIVQDNIITTSTKTVEETIVYATETQYDDSMREGTETITQEGKNGKKTVTYTITNKGGKFFKKTKEKEVITEQPVALKKVIGTKKYYTCSNGTEYDSVEGKNECEKRIAWEAQKAKALKECNEDPDKFNCWYDEYPGTYVHWSYYVYNSYNAPSYNSPKFRTGAICRDGWRSSATGRGACSHHGGVSMWI